MADRMPAPAISWTQSVTVIPTAIFFAIGLALLIVGGCAARKTASFSTPQQLALERRTAVLDTVKSNLDGVAIESSETQACEILETRPPLVIRGPIPAEWPIALTDVQALALQQSQVLRDLGGQVIHSPATVTSDLDRAILTHDPQFGTPAALSAFDRSYGAQVFYDRTDRAFNNATLGGGAFELQQDLITAQARTLRRTRDDPNGSFSKPRYTMTTIALAICFRAVGNLQRSECSQAVITWRGSSVQHDRRSASDTGISFFQWHRDRAHQ